MTATAGGEGLAITGIIIGFVVVPQEDCKDEKLFFSSASEALASRGGLFYKQLRLSSGEVILAEGIEQRGRDAVGDQFYGKPCAGCKELLWSKHSDALPTRCEECEVPHFDLSGFDLERYDPEY